MSEDAKTVILLGFFMFFVTMLMCWLMPNLTGGAMSTYIHCERFDNKTICIYPWDTKQPSQ